MFKYKYVLYYKDNYYWLVKKYSRKVVIKTWAFSSMINRCAEKFIDPELVQFKSISLQEIFSDFMTL